MLFSYCVRAIYVESCSMFVRGGVYRVVKEAMGARWPSSRSRPSCSTTSSLAPSAVFPQAITWRLPQRTAAIHPLNITLPENFTAAAFAIVATLYFWWQNIKGIPESSGKALRIMQLTTIMVLLMIGWCGYTLWVRGAHLPPLPRPENLNFAPDALGWLRGTGYPPSVWWASSLGWAMRSSP